MISLILQILFQSIAVLYLFPKLDSELFVRGGLENAIYVVVLFLVLNWIVRRILVILTFGIGFLLYYATLGFLGLVVNMGILVWIGDHTSLIQVPSVYAAFWGGALLAFISLFFGGGEKKKRERYRK
jgi:putative membrane protein